MACEEDESHVTALCLNCGAMAQTRRNRCEACYLYFRRHAAERPERLIVAHAARQLEHRHMREALKAGACCDTLVIVTNDYVDLCLCEEPPGHAGWHRGWAGEWRWDRHGNLTLERCEELKVSDAAS